MPEFFRADHEIDDLNILVFAQPLGQQHIGIGQIGLYHAHVFAVRRDGEMAALFRVEQGREDAGAVEVGPA